MIHMIWLGGNCPIDFDLWHKINPKQEILLWTEKEIDKLDFNRTLYDKLYVKQLEWGKFGTDGCYFTGCSDIVRYEILYRFGGIYFDADIQPIKEIDTGKLGHSFLVWESEIARPGLIASNIINLEKGHSLAKRMIEKLDGRSVPKDPLFLWIDTGPLLLTETYNNLHRPMRIMPSDMWEGKHFTGYGCSNPNAYTVCKQKYYEEVKHGI